MDKENLKRIVHNKPFEIIQELSNFWDLFVLYVGEENLMVLDKNVLVSDSVQICKLELEKLRDRVMKVTR